MDPPSWFCVTIKHGDTVKKILLYPGMAIGEIKAVLSAAFGIGSAIVGLRDTVQDIHFPLTLLSRAPSYFSSRPVYEILLEGEDYDEEDEDYEEEEDAEEAEYEPLNPLQQPTMARRGSVSNVFQLDSDQAQKLIEIYKYAADEDGKLDRPTFQACFQSVLGKVRAPVPGPART